MEAKNRTSWQLPTQHGLAGTYRNGTPFMIAQFEEIGGSASSPYAPTLRCWLYSRKIEGPLSNKPVQRHKEGKRIREQSVEVRLAPGAFTK